MRLRLLEGFSLIETLTVLTLIALLATFSFPMLRHFLYRSDDQVLQSQLQNAIETASQEARNLGVPVSLLVNEQQTLLIFTDENEDGVIQESEQRLAVMPLALRHGKLYWRAYPRYRRHFLFLPTGLMRSDNGTFWYCRAKATLPSWALILAQSGRMRIVYPNKEGVIKDAHHQLLRCDAVYSL